MARHCRIVRLRPELRQRYLELHREVWPDVEARLTRSHIANFTIFLHGDLLVSYHEYVGSDFEADMRAIADDEVTRRWTELTAPCQMPLTDASIGDPWSSADEVWHLA